VEVPLAVAAVAFLVAYATPIAAPGVPVGVRAACAVVVSVTWMGFALDYAVRLSLADSRRAYVRGHLVDLVVIALPILRPLRLLRLVAVLSVLNRAGARSLRGQVVTYGAAGTLLLLTCGALAITDAERGVPGSNIADLGDGLWWAMTTMTTVGYGDQYPVTTTGRFVAAALMIGGIALLGVVTATFASWLVEHVADATEDDRAVTRDELEALSTEVRRLRDELVARAGPPAGVEGAA
jgi:voltage-gated potassium channel